MSLLSFEEREDILAQIDSFFMAKLMVEEGFEMEPICHYDTSTNITIATCLLYVQERYPYFKIRPSKHEDYIFILTVSLPRKMKPCYREVKKDFDKLFNQVECYYGELSLKWHYNELHVEAISSVYYHQLLKDILAKCKEIKETEAQA